MYALADLSWKGGKAKAGEQINESSIPWRIRQQWSSDTWVCRDAECAFVQTVAFLLNVPSGPPGPDGEIKDPSVCPECGSPMDLVSDRVLVDELPADFIAQQQEIKRELFASAKAADEKYLIELGAKITLAELEAQTNSPESKTKLEVLKREQKRAIKAAEGREEEIMGGAK